MTDKRARRDAPKRIHLDKDGLEAFFGELEAKIMRRLWASGPLSVLDVRNALAPERAYSYNTVMTVLNRLAEKGWVKKRKSEHAAVYAAAMDEPSFKRSAAKALIGVFFGKKALFSAAHFAEALDDVSEKDLDALKKALGAP